MKIIISTILLLNFFNKSFSCTEIANVQGHKICLEEVDQKIATLKHRYETEIYGLRIRAAKIMIQEKIIQKLAKKHGKTEDEYIEEYILGEKNKDLFKESIEKSKGKVKEKKIYYRRGALIDWRKKMIKKGDYKINLSKPTFPKLEIEINKEDPVTTGGSNSKKKKILVFSDYTCPHCKKLANTLDSLSDKAGKNIDIIYKFLPSRNEALSHLISKSSVCTFELSDKKFQKINKIFYNEQDKLSQYYIKEVIPERLKLDKKKYSNCITSKRVDNYLAKVAAQSERANVKATPTIFINGVKFSQNLTTENLMNAIK